MDGHLFDTHSPTCPVCHRSGAIKPHKLLKGLLTCQYCRERLVVSWSGHYVRDPFTLNCLSSGKMLRRESHPLARIRRDFRATPSLLLTLIGGAILLGFAVTNLQSTPSQNSTDQTTTPATRVDR